jgi:Mg2+/Co2+ transporter CorB
MAASLATSALIGLFGEAGVAYATLGMTLLVLIFAEVLPKTYALNYPDRTALLVAPALRRIVLVFGPVVHTIQWIVVGTLRLFGRELTVPHSVEAHEEELRGAIELHRGEDSEIRDERRMLRSVLELGDVEVGEIMTHRSKVVMVDSSLPPPEVVEQVLASPYTRIPLWRDDPDNIVGVLHAKALLRAVNTHRDGLDSLDIESLASAPWFIPDTTVLLDQLHAFRRRREHFALVVDEYGAFMGVVTLEDILEEIVGDISDEHDVAVPGVRPQADGSFVVAGNVTLRDLNREFEWSLPDENATTLAGLILHEARMIPEPGQVFEFYGFRFRILRRVRNQITWVRLTPPKRGRRGAW